MPRSDTENVLFLLQCLSSATQNSGKIDFKAIGSYLQNGATGNAIYLRLIRIKKSVNFVDGPIGPAAASLATPPYSSADTANASNAVLNDASEHPYAPTADLPAPPKKRGAANGGKGKKRKLTGEDEAEGERAEDMLGESEAMDRITPTKKQKATPTKGEKATSRNADISVKAAAEEAAAAANTKVPILAAWDDGVGEKGFKVEADEGL